MTTEAPQVYSIGMLAEAAGVSVKTVRYYSDQGLLPDTVERSSGGHRRYGVEALGVLRTLRGLRGLGLPLPVAGAVVRGEASLEQVLAGQRAEVDRQLVELRWRSAALAAAATPEQLVLLGDALRDGPAKDGFAEFWRRVLPVRLPAGVQAAIVEAVLPQLPTEPTPGQALAYAELRALTTDRAVAAGARAASYGGSAVLTEAIGEAYKLAAPELAGGAAPAPGVAVDAFVAAHARAERRPDSAEFRRELAARPAGPPMLVRYWELVGELDPRPNMATLHTWLGAGLRVWVAQQQ
ncbi:MerR family transcriptional regulator [Kitasatospora sp. LaBMicrA B282]|uniref:MerR family transcriptional regulator n=1 Tax=Kitasatospora sp. LaBMicrA B282 TaxID=3420949 RepID=UPI003D12E3E0